MEFSLGDAILYLDTNMQGLNKGLGDAERLTKQKFGNIQKLMSNVGRGATIAGAAILGGMGYAAKGAADFDLAMREVNTMMGISESDFQTLSKQVRDMSVELGVNAVESAKALYQAISAGVPKENAIEFMTVATKAAIGGVTDTVTAVDGLTSVINAFKIPMADAGRVADIMFTTVKGGKTTFSELSASLYNVAPLAASAGVSFEDVSAAIATLTKQGVPTAQATTQIRAAIQGLIKPNKEMQNVYDQLGIASGDLLIKQYGLAGALKIVSDASGVENVAQSNLKIQYDQAAKKLGEYQQQLTTTTGNKEELTKKISDQSLKLVELREKYVEAGTSGIEGSARQFESIEALGALLSLTGDSAQMAQADIESMKNSSGAANDAYNEMNKSASRQWDQLKSQLGEISIAIGMQLLPSFAEMAKSLAPILKSVAEWIAQNTYLTIGLAAIGGIIAIGGPLLMGLTGMIGLLGTVGGVGLIGSLSVLGGMLLPGVGILLGLTIMAETLYKMTQSDPSTTISRLVDSLGPLGNWIDKYFDAVYSIMTFGWLKGPGTVDFTGSMSLEEVIAERKRREDAGDLPAPPGRATGGNVVKGGIYSINEKGMELFHAPQNGEILNNATTNRLLSALGGGSNGSISITVNANTNADPEEIASKINRVMRRYR